MNFQATGIRILPINMRILKFQTKDFSEYQSWYKDALLQKHLGSTPDLEWLEYVLAETGGCQYSFFENNLLVGVLGVVFPDSKHPHLYITDIAVNPKFRQLGIGAKMLSHFIKKHPLKREQFYIAYVDIKNEPAQSFFKKLGWQLDNKIPNKDEMLTFKFNYFSKIPFKSAGE